MSHPVVPPASAGDAALFNAIVALVGEAGLKVPPIPAVVGKLSQQLASPSCDLREVTRIVGTDQVLAAHILRTSSSSLLSSNRKVGSLSEAVMRVGVNSLFSLAVSLSLGKELTQRSPLDSLRREVFRKAASSAEFCRRLAALRGIEAEGAFLCGLLGTFGSMVALSAIEQVLASRKVEESRPAEFWLDLAARCSDTHGGTLAESWGLPRLVSEVITRRGAKAPDAALVPYIELMEAADGLTRLFYSEAEPSEEKVAAAAKVTTPEARAIVAFMPEVAAAVWALGSIGDSVKAMTGPTPVMEATTSVLKGRLIPVQLAMSVDRGAAGVYELSCTSLAADGLVAEGRQPLPMNQVIKARLIVEEEDFDLFAVVVAVTPTEGIYRLEIKPMGLTGANSARWQALRESKTEAATPPPAATGATTVVSPPRVQTAPQPVTGQRPADQSGGVSLHAKKGLLGRFFRG